MLFCKNKSIIEGKFLIEEFFIMIILYLVKLIYVFNYLMF